MESSNQDTLDQIDKLLAGTNQSWLFGAGISFNSGIPLMGPLTDIIFSKAEKLGKTNDFKVLDHIRKQLPDEAHIEHILSQLGDLRTIAKRSKNECTDFDNITLKVEELDKLHQRISSWIAETIRWGYKNGNPHETGTYDNSFVTIDSHSKFVAALFDGKQLGVSERRKVRIFTTNYDTLLEDALALGRIPYWDGFTGGALAYRSHRYGDEEPNFKNYRAHLIKLHGSIDWHLDEEDRVWRIRDGDRFPTTKSRVLIYPQSTKYLATQRDPFSAQFDLLRRTLGTQEGNILATCGYSFGDEHINQEIELALQKTENKTTLLAFSKTMNKVLEAWRSKPWAERLHIITESGVYVGNKPPVAIPPKGKTHDWWTFEGITKFLNGETEDLLQ